MCVGLHSWLRFSLLEKLLFFCVSTPSSTPSRYLVICRDSQAFLIAISTLPSTLGGSIEKVSVLSIDSRHLLDRSSFAYLNFSLHLDTSRYLYLSKAFSSIPFSTDISIPLDTSAVEIYWGAYLKAVRDSELSFSISLDLSVAVHLPFTLLSLKSSNPLGSCSFLAQITW